MRHARLVTLLVVVNLGLLLLAAAGVVWLARDGLASTDPLAAQARFIRSLIVLGVLASLLTVMANVWIARQLAQPLRRLAKDAVRMGYGDLAAPIVVSSSAELETLAGALEEMRSRLLSQTTDLRRQQAESDAILTGITEGVFAVDRERRMRYLNPQAAAMLGLAPAQALGRFCGDVLNPQGPGGVRPCEEQCPIVHA